MDDMLDRHTISERKRNCIILCDMCIRLVIIVVIAVDAAICY